MSFADDVIKYGITRIYKKRFFAACDDKGNAKESDIQEIGPVDCNGDPINPHVLVPPGKTFRYYTEDDLATIKQKIRDKVFQFHAAAKKGTK